MKAAADSESLESAGFPIWVVLFARRSNLIENLLVVILAFFEKRRGASHHVEFKDKIVKLLDLPILFLSVFNAGEKFFCGLDFFFKFHFKWKASSVFENFMSNAEFRRDMAIIFNLYGLTFAGKIIELPSLHGFSDTLFGNFFENCEKIAHGIFPFFLKSNTTNRRYVTKWLS
jgi:hypothetical protein